MMFGLFLLQVNPYLGPADDSGRYMVLGESLARLHSLRLLNDVHQMRDTLYVPGFPAMIAFWLLITGRDPGAIVLPVKFTLLALAMGMLPMIYGLLERAKLARGYVVAAMFTTAACPSFMFYANNVMSEIPMTFLCLASVSLLETDARDADDKVVSVPVWKRLLSLACGVLAFTVRASGVVLLGTLTLWFLRRFGWKWGALAALVSLIIVGGWQFRNRRIIQQDPPNTHDTYLRQFTLKAPEAPHSGRIQMNAAGLALRVRMGFPAYIGMIPRSLLNSMSLGPHIWPRIFWTRLFWVIAIPLGGLILLGYGMSWKRGLTLSALFSTLFWLFSAMWPWRDARFLIPLAPFFIVFLYLAAAAISNRLRPAIGTWTVRALQGAALTLLFLYFAHVNAEARKESGGPVYPGYALGRIPEEGGFYAACAWLKRNATSNALIMGRPAYLLHLYSGHPTVQIEPAENPRLQEKAYIAPKHVRYILQDVWFWAHTASYIDPYIKVYHDKWELAWKDPHGSGTRIWRRLPDPPGSSAPGKSSPRRVL